MAIKIEGLNIRVVGNLRIRLWAIRLDRGKGHALGQDDLLHRPADESVLISIDWLGLW